MNIFRRKRKITKYAFTEWYKHDLGIFFLAIAKPKRFQFKAGMKAESNTVSDNDHSEIRFIISK